MKCFVVMRMWIIVKEGWIIKLILRFVIVSLDKRMKEGFCIEGVCCIVVRIVMLLMIVIIEKMELKIVVVSIKINVEFKLVM